MNFHLNGERDKEHIKDISSLGSMLIFQMIVSGVFVSSIYIIYQYISLDIIMNSLQLKENIALLGIFIANIITIFLYKKKLKLNISSWLTFHTVNFRGILGWTILVTGISRLLGYFGESVVYILNKSFNFNINIPNGEFAGQSVLITMVTILTHCIIVPIGEEFIQRHYAPGSQGKREWFCYHHFRHYICSSTYKYCSIIKLCCNWHCFGIRYYKRELHCASYNYSFYV